MEHSRLFQQGFPPHLTSYQLGKVTAFEISRFYIFKWRLCNLVLSSSRVWFLRNIGESLHNVTAVLFDFRILQIYEFFMVLMSLGVTFRDGYVVVETLSRAENLNFWQSLISEEEKSLTTVHFWVSHPCQRWACISQYSFGLLVKTIISSLAEERIIKGTEERGRSKRCTKAKEW